MPMLATASTAVRRSTWHSRSSATPRWPPRDAICTPGRPIVDEPIVIDRPVVDRPVFGQDIVRDVIVIIYRLVRLFAQPLQSRVSGRAISCKLIQLTTGPDK